MDDRAAVDDVADAGTAYEGDLSNRLRLCVCKSIQNATKGSVMFVF